jgi:hypothetical protein
LAGKRRTTHHTFSASLFLLISFPFCSFLFFHFFSPRITITNYLSNNNTFHKNHNHIAQHFNIIITETQGSQMHFTSITRNHIKIHKELPHTTAQAPAIPNRQPLHPGRTCADGQGLRTIVLPAPVGKEDRAPAPTLAAAHMRPQPGRHTQESPALGWAAVTP